MHIYMYVVTASSENGHDHRYTNVVSNNVILTLY